MKIQLSGKELKKQIDAKAKKIKTDFETANQGIDAVGNLNRAAFTLMDKWGKQDSESKEKRAKAAFAIQKSLSLASTGVKGAEAIITTLRDSPLSIGPVPNPAGIASFAAVISSTAASLATIATSTYEGGGRGGSTPTPSISEGQSAPSFNLVEGSADNQIQNSIQNSNDAPIKAYVVGQDVTSQQSLDRQIESNSGI